MGSRKNDLVKIGQLLNQHARGPYADQLRGKLADWRDPRAKALRRRRRVLRVTKVWTGAGAVVVETATLDPGLTGAGLIGAAVVSIVAAVATGVRSWRLHREPLPEAIRPRSPLPAGGSLARDPMRKLGEAEGALDDLLTQLSRGAMVPPDAVTDARRTGTDAASTLRALADQIQAVERARAHAPAADHPFLDDGVRRLRAQLDEGVGSYGSLVAAAAHAVAATSHSAPTYELTDATDRLAALALALRDLSRGPA